MRDRINIIDLTISESDDALEEAKMRIIAADNKKFRLTLEVEKLNNEKKENNEKR